MATLGVATNWHHHTDGVSGEMYHPIILTFTNKREGGENSKGAKESYKHKWHSSLHVVWFLGQC